MPSEAQTTPSSHWRAAVVGCGDVWGNHRDAIAADPAIELVAIADTDPGRREQASHETGVPGFPNVICLLNNMDVDVVHVCTPHDQHLPVSKIALSRGVHVLQEKPLAPTLTEGRQLAEAAQTSSAKFGVCYQNRYNDASARAYALLAAGELGDIEGGYVTCVWTRSNEYYRARPWRADWARSGGGVLINQSIHTLDLLQWLLGGVTAIIGKASQYKFAGITQVEDTAVACLTHPSGAMSMFFASLAGPVMRDVEIEIVGSLGKLTIRDGLRVELVGQPAQFFPEPKLPGRGRDYWGHSHQLLINDFYAHLNDPEPFWIGAPQALASLWLDKQVQWQSPELYPHYASALEPG